MDKQQAQKIIRDTFESSFDKSGFTGFIKNLLNMIDEAPFTYQGNYIPDAYKQYIKTLERIGKFSDGENSFDILVITLQKETSLERARTMQRNFIAWYLNGSRGGEMKDAALAAFVSPGKEDWRFSLVKMDYKFEKTKTGRMKVKEEFTPARRWSFLVGANEKSHTAQSRLVNILKNDEQDPTLEEIEKAFDIETVTKEFFLKYRELFLHTKEELDRVVKKDPKVKADFEAKGVDTVNFAKKLLGQIIFLYFLQKKGWFGVGRDDDWGTGSKHFLRELFEKKHSDYNNFYNDILEPLFYEALRTGEDRKHEDYYYSRFDCKIPFLNGGLFDPIGDYDWVRTDILIPDKLFSNNVKTKEGDKGTGILDVFDRYNFTVKEDEPLEKEVAIDPELLGKSYEKFNAIRPDNYDEFKKALKSGKKGEENKFNKKFGVYYTPREIVHYMCQQSLINYLDSIINTRKKSIGSKPVAVQKKLFGPQAPVQLTFTADSYKSIISKKDIETLIQIGEQVSENEAIFLEKEQKIKKGEQKTTSIKLILPDSIRKNAKLIDDKLAEITVCDPAVGSGAFPVGMMSEIVRARNVLSTFVQDKNRTPYNFKRRCIEHSLYGVDIDPGAVEIAKLRLWLSLVVDEDDIKNIKPLPNLDYRIMQGNSLISEFMGINFDTDKKKKSDKLLFKDETDKLIEHFQEKKDEFLNESNVSRKSKLKEEVDELLVKIFETKLRTQKADYFNRAKNIKNKYSGLRNEKQRDELIKRDKEKLNKESDFDLELAEKQLKEFTSGRKIKPFFLWNLYFSEVFHDKGGFDVVIANPPYFNISTISKDFYHYLADHFDVIHTGYNDIVYYFIYLGIKLLRKTGCCTLITSNYYLGNDYAKKLRNFLKDHVYTIINFKDYMVFDGVSIHTCISLSYKEVKSREVIFFEPVSEKKRTFNNIESQLRSFSLKRTDLTDNWLIADRSNTAIIDKIKKNSILLGTISTITKGATSGDREIFTILKSFAENSRFENELLKTSINSKDIKKYVLVDSGKYLIYTDNSTTIENYPNIYKYLVKHKKKLSERNEVLKRMYPWYRLERPREKEIFDAREKLVVPYRAENNTFAYDNNQGFNDGGGSYTIAIKEGEITTIKYLLGILNSKLMNWFYKFIGKPKGKIREYFNRPLSLIPMKKISLTQQQPFITFVDKILSLTQSENYLENPQKQAKVKDLEAKIDRLVYQLYGLTPEEIKIVEGENANAD
jgi:Eco57I restriction-modification methylase/TaqI-like C-terminal specificity domain